MDDINEDGVGGADDDGAVDERLLAGVPGGIDANADAWDDDVGWLFGGEVCGAEL